MRRIDKKKWSGNVEIVEQNIRKSDSFSELVDNLCTIKTFVLYKGDDGVYSSEHIKDALYIIQNNLSDEDLDNEKLNETSTWEEHKERITSEFGIRKRIGEVPLK